MDAPDSEYADISAGPRSGAMGTTDHVGLGSHGVAGALPTAPNILMSKLAGDATDDAIPVEISYEIIRLFSEGLYQSPHKAIEELASNSFDAGATCTYILTPRTGSDAPTDGEDSLWVIDNGSGMDKDGFRRLWRVADSAKTTDKPIRGRLPIGQFGIGLLPQPRKTVGTGICECRVKEGFPGFVRRAEKSTDGVAENAENLTGCLQFSPPPPLPREK